MEHGFKVSNTWEAAKTTFPSLTQNAPISQKKHQNIPKKINKQYIDSNMAVSMQFYADGRFFLINTSNMQSKISLSDEIFEY
jgi:hypothetical protein